MLSDCSSGATVSQNEEKTYTWSLYDNHNHDPNSPFHERILAVDYTLPGKSVSKDGPSVTFGELDFTVATGGWEFGNAEINLFDVGRVSLGASIGCDGFSAEAMFSFFAPSATFDVFGIVEVTISGHLGSWGGKFEYQPGKKASIGLSCGYGLSISLDW